MVSDIAMLPTARKVPRVHKLGNYMISRSAQAGKCTNVHKVSSLVHVSVQVVH